MKLTFGFQPGNRVHHMKTKNAGTVVQVTKTSLRVVWDGNWEVTNWVRKKTVTRSLAYKNILIKIKASKDKIIG